MDAPFHPSALDQMPRRHGPVAAWIPLAIITSVLGLAAFAASQVTDTRDFASRHATVPQRIAL